MTLGPRVPKWLALPILLAGVMSACSPRVAADTITTFTLSGVTFDNGGGANGSFTWNFTTGTLVSVDVLAEGGIFDNSFSYPTHVTASSFEGNYDSQIESWNIQFVLNQPLTPNTGSPITIDPAQSFLILDYSGNGGPVITTNVIAGRVDPSPRPGDLNCDGAVNFADINPFVTLLGG